MIKDSQPIFRSLVSCYSKLEGIASSGDFSHCPQHVFWTCLDQIVKSKDVLPKKYQFFGQVKMKMDRLTKTKMKSIK